MPKPHNPKEPPSAAAHGQMIASLARQTGEPQARWKERIGEAVDGRSGREIADAVIAAQREFPKRTDPQEPTE